MLAAPASKLVTDFQSALIHNSEPWLFRNARIATNSIYHCRKRTSQRVRQSGNALRKLIRSAAAAGLWSGGVSKDQERCSSRKSQSGAGRKAAWDGPLIGPGKLALQKCGEIQ